MQSYGLIRYKTSLGDNLLDVEFDLVSNCAKNLFSNTLSGSLVDIGCFELEQLFQLKLQESQL